MDGLGQARRDIALSKHVIKNGHVQPQSKYALVDLRGLLDDVSTPSLRLMASHLVSIMERLQAVEIDETRAVVEIKLNQQLLKVMTLDFIKGRK